MIIQKKAIASILVIFGAMTFSSSIASTDIWIDHGQYSTDVNTSLNWYKLTNTQNISYVDVVQSLSGSLIDWSVANSLQLTELFINNGIPTTLNNNPSNPIIWNDNIQTLASHLGNTYSSSSTDINGFLGFYHDSVNPLFVWYAGAYVQYSNPTGSFITGVDQLIPNGAGPWINGGTYLVKSATTADLSLVPIPASLALFASGLLSLGALRKKSYYTINNTTVAKS